MKTLIIYNENISTQTLSYQVGWIKAFKKNTLFHCDYLNLNNFFPTRKKIPKIKELKYLLFKKYDCIILLHSTFSNACLVPFYVQKILREKNAFKVFFIGNEYKHMPEKIKFVKYLKINLFITQSHQKEVINLYKKELNIFVEHITNTGIDEEIFYPKIDYKKRLSVIGYRTGPDPLYFGKQERINLFNFLKNYSSTNKKYNFDVSIDVNDRFNYLDWPDFINRCKCMFASNTGFDYFFLNDDIRNKVNQSKLKNIDEIFNTFFLNITNGTKFRCVTGKTIEPAACKTPLIQVEGDYDKFKSNIHYIPLNEDYSNIDECLEKLEDNLYINTIIENSYKLVKTEYLYRHLINKLYNNVKKNF